MAGFVGSTVPLPARVFMNSLRVPNPSLTRGDVKFRCANSARKEARAEPGKTTLCVGAVMFLLWVLRGLVKECVGTTRRRAHSQEIVPYPSRGKQQVVIAIDSHRRTRSTGVAARVGQHQVALANLEERGSATGRSSLYLLIL